MKTVVEVCTPRKDILSGKLTDDVYAAHLGKVRDNKAPAVYQDPKLYFDNTFPTNGLRTVVKETFARLIGADSGASFIVLQTSLGGGKTHALIALYHIAKGGSATPGAGPLLEGMKFKPINVATIIGSEPGMNIAGNGPRTLWGIMAQQLFGEDGYNRIRVYDEQLSDPGEDALVNLFGKEKCLILIDEIALYLVKASTVKVGDSTLAKQTTAFLQDLASVAASQPNVVVVMTSLDKDSPFKDETEQLKGLFDSDQKKQRAKDAIIEADEVKSRTVKTLTPTVGEEFPNVVRHRLFETVNPLEAKEVCEQYYHMLQDPSNIDYIPPQARDPGYLNNLLESYPFHPELLNILRTKTSSVPNFNKTRGVLRLLSKMVRDVWNNERPEMLIHAYDVDLRKQDFVEELISRLDKNEYQSAIAADISNRRDKPRAAEVDEKFSEPLGTMICNVIFLNSITGAAGSDVVHGAKEAEIYLSLARPDFDLKKADDALKLLENTCFYLVRQGPIYAFHTEPNLNKLIENAKRAVPKTRIVDELHDRIAQLYGSRKYFEPVIFANEPSKVPDNTDRPKLVVMDFRDCDIASDNPKVPEEVSLIYENKGTSSLPRVYANNLLFLLADRDEVENMENSARIYLALNQLVKDMEEGASYLGALTQIQRAHLKKIRQEAELYIKISIVVCHKHLVLPSSQANLEQVGSRRPLRIRTMRVTDSEVKRSLTQQSGQDQAIVDFLREIEAARTIDDNEWSPDFIIEELWDRMQQALPGEGFHNLFYRNPGCGLILSDDLIKRSFKKGLSDGRWAAVSQGELYDSKNYLQYYSGSWSDLEVVLKGTEKYQQLTEQFYCSHCGKRKKECICDDKCPTCGNPKSQCSCQKEVCVACGMPKEKCICKQGPGVVSANQVKMERAVKDLSDKLIEKGIETISKVTIRPDDRNPLLKLAMAFPQFGKVDIRLDIDFTINQPQQDKKLHLAYRGDLSGFNQIKGIISNYEGRLGFSSQNLLVDIDYPDGIKTTEILSLLGEKISQFTDEELYSITVVPMKERGKRD